MRPYILITSGASLIALFASALFVEVSTTVSVSAAGVAIVTSLALLLSFLIWAQGRTWIGLKPACVVHLDGRLDAGVAETHKAILLDLVNRGHSNLLLNCGRVTFIDSAGLSVLVSSVKAVAPRKGVVALTHLEEHLKKLFQITALDKVFAIYAKDKDALEALHWHVADQVSPLRAKVPARSATPGDGEGCGRTARAESPVRG